LLVNGLAIHGALNLRKTGETRAISQHTSNV
jgi:hypothetical protein